MRKLALVFVLFPALFACSKKEEPVKPGWSKEVLAETTASAKKRSNLASIAPSPPLLFAIAG